MSSASTPNTGPGFRLDINLLRAIAVVGVVLYHFRIGPVPGGFAGVDLFFVVSGYLMTRIISEGIDRGGFSLWRFYAARARRIVPALAAMCLVLLVLSQFWVDPLTRREIAADIAASILFVSNFTYWSEAGYFDTVAKSKWLLHTWSLSVEWQFYLLLPLALIALHRLMPGRRRLLATLWIGMILSFALSVMLADRKPALAFYLLPTRAWELLAGGLVYLHLGNWRPGPRLSGGLALLGLALIAFAFLGLDNLVAWPSFATLLPVAGAALVIAARPERAPGLDSRPVIAIGLWSYSIYIWHWPVVVGLGYFGYGGTLATFAGIAATLILAGVSYHTIEMPFRQPPASGTRLWKPRRLMLAGLVILAGTTTASLVAASGYGAWDNVVATRARLAEIAIQDSSYPSECGGFSLRSGLRPCVIGEPSRRNVLFLGDSHAEPFYAHLEAGRPDHAFTFLTYGGCPPLPGTDKALPGSKCREFLEAAWAQAESGAYQQVVLAAFWPIYLEPYRRGGDNNHLLCFEEAGRCRIQPDAAGYRRELDAAFERLAARIRALRARGIEVTLLAPMPFVDFDIPHESVRRAFLGIEPDALRPIPLEAVRAASAETKTYLERLAAASGADLVDPLAVMCGDAGCDVSDDGVLPLYRDSNHLTGSAIRNGRLDFIDAAVLKR